MEIKDLRELKALFQLCRKQGVTEIVLGEVSFKLGDLPENHSKNSSQPDVDPLDPYKNFPQGELTPEQLAFYSSGGMPENDPENEANQDN